jgi:spore germination protein YaaH
MDLVKRLFRNTKLAVLFLLIPGALVGGILGILTAPKQQTVLIQMPTQPTAAGTPQRLLHGKVASLSWIIGQDCQRGMQAYLHSVDTLPDAALVGTGWLDPETGKLISGKSNNCVRGSVSMDSVVQTIHKHGGMAYLTLTMMTDGTADAWTPQQEAEYIAKAANSGSYVDTIVREVKRANYNGVIMDLEEAAVDYPSIQRLFATYNQHMWTALRAINKLYGIALIHKVSDHDSFYFLNGFQDWRLLAHTADFMVIMALDQSYSTPGPGVSLPWLEQILAYTQQTMPDMLPHIIWELPLYGDSWHQSNGKWIFDGTIAYQDAQQITTQISASQIDATASDLDDPANAHLVYSDEAGVKHALWYLTARNLYTIITAFYQKLEELGAFGTSYLQIAVWYRTTSEPGELWPMLVTSLPNAS